MLSQERCLSQNETSSVESQRSIRTRVGDSLRPTIENTVDCSHAYCMNALVVHRLARSWVHFLELDTIKHPCLHQYIGPCLFRNFSVYLYSAWLCNFELRPPDFVLSMSYRSYAFKTERTSLIWQRREERNDDISASTDRTCKRCRTIHGRWFNV